MAPAKRAPDLTGRRAALMGAVAAAFGTTWRRAAADFFGGSDPKDDVYDVDQALRKDVEQALKSGVDPDWEERWRNAYIPSKMFPNPELDELARQQQVTDSGNYREQPRPWELPLAYGDNCMQYEDRGVCLASAEIAAGKRRKEFQLYPYEYPPQTITMCARNLVGFLVNSGAEVKYKKLGGFNKIDGYIWATLRLPDMKDDGIDIDFIFLPAENIVNVRAVTAAGLPRGVSKEQYTKSLRRFIKKLTDTLKWKEVKDITKRPREIVVPMTNTGFSLVKKTIKVGNLMRPVNVDQYLPKAR